MTITIKINDQTIVLQPDEAVLFCSINVPGTLLDTQKKVAASLAELYEKGEKTLNKNQSEAQKYALKAHGITPRPTNYSLADIALKILAFFTTCRLLIARLNRFLDLPFIAKAFLNRYFAIGGFSYFKDLIISLYVVISNAYHAMPLESDEERRKRFFIRLKRRTRLFFQCFLNALREDDRLYCILNALVWGVLNLSLFLFAPPLAFLLPLLAFGFDVVNKYYQMTPRITTAVRLADKINACLTFSKEGSDANALFELHIALEKNIVFERQKRRAEMTLVILIFIGAFFYSIPGLNIGLVALGCAIVLAASMYSLSKKCLSLKKECMPDSTNDNIDSLQEYSHYSMESKGSTQHIEASLRNRTVTSPLDQENNFILENRDHFIHPFQKKPQPFLPKKQDEHPSTDFYHLVF